MAIYNSEEIPDKLDNHFIYEKNKQFLESKDVLCIHCIRKLFDIGEERKIKVEFCRKGNSNLFPKGNLPHFEIGHRRFYFTHRPREAHSNLAKGFYRAMVIILSKAEILQRSKKNMFIV